MRIHPIQVSESGRAWELEQAWELERAWELVTQASVGGLDQERGERRTQSRYCFCQVDSYCNRLQTLLHSH